jgi:hypothetical protein
MSLYKSPEENIQRNKNVENKWSREWVFLHPI